MSESKTSNHCKAGQSQSDDAKATNERERDWKKIENFKDRKQDVTTFLLTEHFTLHHYLLNH